MTLAPDPASPRATAAGEASPVPPAAAAFNARTLAAGATLAFVGFASSFPVVLNGLLAAGASPSQAASGLAALAVAMGLCAIVLSVGTRMPVAVAWSTPGAALLAAGAAPAGGYSEAVGAFLVCGALLALSGVVKPLGRAVAAIPPTIARAMLAGVLIPLCLAPVRFVADAPAAGLAVVAAWALVMRLNRLYAVPAALAAAVLVAWLSGAEWRGGASLLATPELVAPAFSVAATLGVAIPLYVVTMAAQNVPGFAVLAACGYRPPAAPLLAATGAFSLAVAPLGGHAVNLAAITAALAAGPDAHPDPRLRWGAAVLGGTGSVLLGVLAGAATGLVASAPPLLVEAVAGLALVGTCAGAMAGALEDARDREAAIVTVLVAASGVTVLGVGGAFWGLLAGLALRAAWRR